jgi:hypothetical protein
MDVCIEYEGGDEFEIQRYLECTGTFSNMFWNEALFSF